MNDNEKIPIQFEYTKLYFNYFFLEGHGGGIGSAIMLIIALILAPIMCIVFVVEVIKYPFVIYDKIIYLRRLKALQKDDEVSGG